MTGPWYADPELQPPEDRPLLVDDVSMGRVESLAEAFAVLLDLGFHRQDIAMMIVTGETDAEAFRLTTASIPVYRRPKHRRTA